MPYIPKNLLKIELPLIVLWSLDCKHLLSIFTVRQSLLKNIKFKHKAIWTELKVVRYFHYYRSSFPGANQLVNGLTHTFS